MPKMSPLVLLLLLCGLSSPLLAQPYGNALAVGDAEVLVTGPLVEQEPGTVYVYAPGADGWTETAQLTASDAAPGDRFGRALAHDGGTLLVGATAVNETTGAVYVFEKDGSTGSWMQTARLTASDAAAGDAFGRSVVLSGTTALVGAPGRDGSTGAVYVFEKDASTGAWTETARLDAAEPQEDLLFGLALALDGDHLLVGAPGLEENRGAVYAYRYDAGAWQEAGSLPADSLNRNAFFGVTIALHDGHALVGQPRGNGFRGSVSTFAFAADVWQAGGELTLPDAPRGASFGAAIAMTDAGAWIGAPRVGGTGAAFAFTPGDDGWTLTDTLTTDLAENRDQFGAALAFGENVAVVTLAGDDYGKGTAVVFERASADESWTGAGKIFNEIAGLEPVTGGQVDCIDGAAGLFDCEQVDMLSFLPIRAIGGGRGVELNDVWGWTDPETGREYALAGRVDGTSFVDVTDPYNPVYLGDLPKTEGSPGTAWRDIKVYKDHAFIVSDNAGRHGMQIFDLTQLRDVTAPVTFEETARYDRVHSVHNIVINEETGYAYAVGSSSGGETCGGGLHMINIQDPTNPVFAGCFADTSTGRRGTGYSHDAQCVVYEGPDPDHEGREICFGANETALSIADVTDKENPVALSTGSYPNVAYTHQGWLTEDQRYFFINDELDEIGGNVTNTRTLIWDVSDLDDPVLVREFFLDSGSTDHNLYIRGNLMYQSNYLSGLWVIDITDPENPVEVGSFDSSPFGDDVPTTNGGSWSNYPFFESGIIVVSSIGEGLFVLKKKSTGI